MENGINQDSDDDLPLSAILKSSTTSKPAGSTKKRAEPREKASPLPNGAVEQLRNRALKAKPRKAGTGPRKQHIPTSSKTSTVLDKKLAIENSPNTNRSPAKKYSLPGQRRDPPPENDPLRLFYTTMRDEKLRKYGHSSILADEWLMSHGLLDEETARRVFEAQRKRKSELLAL
jgi:hypothetical protein